MNRIDRIFQDLRATGGKALMPFLTAGDPDLPATAQLLPAIEQAGASVVEVGIPFSDPIADGPVIQASMSHALERGVRVSAILEMIASIRPKLSMGLVAMVSYSIVHRLGLDRWVQQAKAAGFDGFIFPDLPLEESRPAQEAVASAGLILSMLIAPTTPIERARQIAQASSGFVYLLSRAGITGERATLPPDLPQRISQLRQVTDLPIAVGFGISNAQQVGQVVSVADAAIVGSALMRQVAQHRQEPPQVMTAQVGRFVEQLAAGLPSKSAAIRR